MYVEYMLFFFLRNRLVWEKIRIIVGNIIGYLDDFGFSVIDLDEVMFDNLIYGILDLFFFI